MIMKTSIFPIIGCLFHPSYMLVNAKLLGKAVLDTDKCGGKPEFVGDVINYNCIKAETYLASFGIASSTMSIILLATGVCFIFGLSNIAPQAAGSGNFKLVGTYLNRFIICHLMIFVPFTVLIELFIPYVFVLLKQNAAVTALATQYVRGVAPSILLY